MKNKEINEVGILVQVVLVVMLLYSLILTLFENDFQILLNIKLGLTLFSMAYNNQKVYKQKGMTICYVVVGIISLIMAII